MALDVEHIKKRIAGLTKIGGKRQYTAAVKKEVLEYVAAKIAAGATEAAACTELELHQATVTGWRRGPRSKRSQEGSQFRPVEISMPASGRRLVLVLPGGARIEGLDLSDVVELARSLA